MSPSTTPTEEAPFRRGESPRVHARVIGGVPFGFRGSWIPGA